MEWHGAGDATENRAVFRVRAKASETFVPFARLDLVLDPWFSLNRPACSLASPFLSGSTISSKRICFDTGIVDVAGSAIVANVAVDVTLADVVD